MGRATPPSPGSPTLRSQDAGPQACLQDPQAFQPDQGGRRAQVREHLPPRVGEGREEAQPRPQDPAPGTPQTVQRKRHIRSLKTAKIAKSKAEAAEYHKLLQLRLKEARERRSESLAKKRALRSSSQA